MVLTSYFKHGIFNVKLIIQQAHVEAAPGFLGYTICVCVRHPSIEPMKPLPCRETYQSQGSILGLHLFDNRIYEHTLINVIPTFTWMQGCVFTKSFDKAMMISDAMESGTIQINSAPGRGPDHFPFQVTLLHLFSLTYIIINFILRYINYITAHKVKNSLYEIKVPTNLQQR